MASFLWDEPIDHENAGKMSALTEAIHSATLKSQNLKTDTPKGPISIAIFGPWGSGKTSILKCLEHKFKESSPESSATASAVTIWFEPWRYENEDNLIVPLLTEMISTITEEMEKSGEKEREKLENAKKAAIKTGMKLLGRVAKATARTATGFVANKIGVKTEDIEQLGKDFLSYYEGESERYDYPVSENQAFKNDFEALVKMAGTLSAEKKAKPSRPVCIFIDDLDRCSSEQVRRLLESMKNFLWVEGVTYVLALDKEQVTMALAEQHLKIFESLNEGALLAAKERAKNYMEKFFLYSYDLSNGSDFYEKHVVEQARNHFFAELKGDFAEHANKDINWDNFEGLLKQSALNLRKIKRVLRWFYYELHMDPIDKNLEAQFAELIFSENYSVIWLNNLSEFSVAIRQSIYSNISKLLRSQYGDVEGFKIRKDFNDAVVDIIEEPIKYKERLEKLSFREAEASGENTPENGKQLLPHPYLTVEVVEVVLRLANSSVGRTIADLMQGEDHAELERMYRLAEAAKDLRP